jgi:hypothetical protein
MLNRGSQADIGYMRRAIVFNGYDRATLPGRDQPLLVQRYSCHL